MKKLLTTLAISLLALAGFAQENRLTFKINTIAYSSDGNDVKTGAVFVFFDRNTFQSVGKITFDVNCYTSVTAKNKGEDMVWFCTNPEDRVKTKITSSYMPIESVKQISYIDAQNWLQEYLEGIYGDGNVSVVP